MPLVMVGALVPARRPVAPPPVGRHRYTSIGDYLFAFGLPVRPPPRGGAAQPEGGVVRGLSQ